MTKMKKAVAQLLTGSTIEEDEGQVGFFAKMSRLFIYIAFILMGLGNWSDTKELITEGYQGFITHFTDRVEQKSLNTIRVGNYLAHVEANIGMPTIIKSSSINSALKYRYYKQDKYLLTLITEQQRVSGVVVHSLFNDSVILDRFAPQIPFTDLHLLTDSIESITQRSNDFFFDSNNLIYFMTTTGLGAAGMQLQLTAGFTEYDGQQDHFKSTLDELGQVLMLDETEKVAPLAKKLTVQAANFYAVYEIDEQIIADSLLTRYEFNAYFKD
ncbi:ETEC_3214 domain-containing protein [Shewanella psychromarinicola]|uniref:Uncharacterized protein n=1 Tax=Shewanella psychromarinicola TaxID=2487742 RepID=A0ABM7BX50_9GAMM|nr:ETEC_3214 domain-containing protein [Shewanella psychromarinicola]AZG34735.1 hypothetical protein EGC80_07245 [Shewanella psychromarinicola]MCL1082246.1 hypothetical protein [Shewanella psychromarinicola]